MAFYQVEITKEYTTRERKIFIFCNKLLCGKDAKPGPCGPRVSGDGGSVSNENG